MYYPVQIPHLLSPAFRAAVCYQEERIASLSDFCICYWQMLPAGEGAAPINNIIIADGCIDLVVSLDQKQIGFSGTRQTDFHYEIQPQQRFMGLRLKPGAFHQLTRLPAERAMDRFLPLKQLFAYFDEDAFFQHEFEEAKEALINFFHQQIMDQQADQYTQLFDHLSKQLPETVNELCQRLHMSERTCQRQFKKVYGLSPKKVLSILRFQKTLTHTHDSLNSAAITEYYDQSHLIADFKRNIGITPRELLAYYQK
ncbi:hypothetical protein NRIC_07320 [Enterococcus florum]|uniref:HTH araC/xylS-type domain-containing protein n=1 Tax=Enterococcus florum TaxID=2480627 RepID=A0A4P5P9E3_9ENTE|nr:helix-turn-helix transcriptional regulator [Enterococcus florum]GCF92841.1 hypothetical protein NRIC_07320 [Enterococcus florum]